MNLMIFRTSISAICFGLILLLASCEKYDRNIEGDINIYLLDDYTTAENSMKILSDGIVLAEEPIASYSEIIEYNSEEYSFKMSMDAITRIGNEFGSAFAVTLEDEVIYTGYFWSDVSSAVVDWIVMDMTLYEFSISMTVQLGYPWLFDEWSIPDRRNDNRLLSVFARDGKLRD